MIFHVQQNTGNEHSPSRPFPIRIRPIFIPGPSSKLGHNRPKNITKTTQYSIKSSKQINGMQIFKASYFHLRMLLQNKKGPVLV